MGNRILSGEVVDTIKMEYEAENTPDYHENINYETAAQMQYISNEKIQRMQPEKVVDVLLDSGQYNIKNTGDLISILSAATGRSAEDLRTAVFGTGPFDEKEFYEPTELEKKAIKCFIKSAGESSCNLDEELDKIYKQLKDEAIPEFNSEVKSYLHYYLENGLPSWLI